MSIPDPTSSPEQRLKETSNSRPGSMEDSGEKQAESSHQSALQFKYRAFLSYRHTEQDRAIAQRLHRSLERYRVPRSLRKEGAPRRIGKIFRDEEELAASSDLSQSILAALRNSEWLVVLCSPRARSSRWINQEVLEFQRLGRSDRILPYLIEGEPKDAFPPALYNLKEVLAEPAEEERTGPTDLIEPLAADARPRTDERDWKIRRKAKLRLLARFLNRDYDDLKRREDEWRLRRALLASTSGLVILATITILSVLTVFSTRRAAQESERAAAADERALREGFRAETEAQRAQMEAERAAAEARDRRRTAYFNTVRLADEARRQALLPRLRFLLDSTPPEERGWEWERLNFLARRGQPLNAGFQWVESIAISSRGRWVAASGSRERSDLVVWRRSTRAIAFELNSGLGRPALFRFSPDERRLVIATRTPPSAFVELDRLSVFELDTRRRVLTLNPPSNGQAWALTVDPHLRFAASFEPESTSEGGVVRLWDLTSGALLGEEEILWTVRRLSFSADASRLLLISMEVSGETRLQRWTTRPLAAESTLVALKADWLMSPLPDLSEILGTDETKLLTAWNVVTGTARHLHPEPLTLKQLTFGTGGHWAAVASKSFGDPNWSDSERVLFFPRHGQPIALPWEKGNVLLGAPPINGSYLDGIEISPEGRHLLIPRGADHASGLPPRIQIFDTQTGRQTANLSGDLATGWGLRSVFLPNGLLLAATSRNEIAVYDLQSGREINSLLGHEVGTDHWINDLKVSEDGRYAVSSDRGKGTVILWNLLPEEDQALTLHAETAVKALAWSDEGKWLLSGGTGPGPGPSGGMQSGLLEVWNVGSLARDRAFFAQDFSLRGIAKVPGRSWVVAHDDFDGISVWDFKTGRRVRVLQPGQQLVKPVVLPHDSYHSTFPVYSHSFRAVDCKRGALLCAAAGIGDGAVRFWDPSRSQEVALWRPFKRTANAVAFSADGRFIAAGGADGKVKLAETDSLREVWSLKLGGGTVSSLAMDPMGRWVAAGLSEGGIALIEGTKGEVIFRINAHLREVSALTFEPSRGDRLASASFDGTIKVWDCALGLEALALTGHQGPVTALAFDPLGLSLASGGSDRTVRIWQTPRRKIK